MSDLLRRAFERLGLNSFSSIKESFRIRLQQLIPKLKQRKIMIPAPVVIGIVLFILDYWIRVVKKPKLYHNVNETNQEILNKCPSLHQAYWPTIWCYNNHLNTIAGVLFRGHVSFERRREILSLEDSGVLGLDWFEDKITANDDRVPIVLFIPGLNGGSRSIYLRHTAKEMRRRMRVKCVAMNYRGTNGTELLTPKSYCGAYTGDLRQVCNHIRREYPEAPIFAVGYSLGSNILVKYLGEEGDKTPLSGAVSVSNPFDFVKSSEVMAKSPFYNWQLTSSTVKTFKGQQEAYRNVPELDFDVILKSKRLRDFDDKFTRVVFGYPTVDDYYKDASSGEYIHNINIPTLLVNAYDDPIVDPTALPREQAQSNKNVILAVTKKGGHVSFVEGLWPGGSCYVDRVIAEYIQALIELHKNNVNNMNVNNHHEDEE